MSGEPQALADLREAREILAAARLLPVHSTARGNLTAEAQALATLGLAEITLAAATPPRIAVEVPEKLEVSAPRTRTRTPRKKKDPVTEAPSPT